MPDLDDPRKRQPGEHERLKHHQRLREVENRAAPETIRDDAGDGTEEQPRNLSGEDDHGEPEGIALITAGRRGQAIDQPRHGGRLHPSADKRHSLSDKEQSEVAVRQQAQHRCHKGCRQKDELNLRERGERRGNTKKGDFLFVFPLRSPRSLRLIHFIEAILPP